jgi:Tol biopolymer transport system component
VQANSDVLWTYDVGGRQANPLDGTRGASYPFWSPDGKFIGFFADGKLKKVAVSGGQTQVLCEAPNGRGGTWNRDAVIVFTPDGSGGLFRVSASGGSPAELTRLDKSRFETTHRWPVFLPDGEHFLYLAANFSGNTEHNAIFLGSLASQERRLLVRTSSSAAYAEPGFLLYLRDKTLVTQSFNAQRYALSGEPQTLIEEVEYQPQTARAVFSVSGSEVLVAQTGRGANVSRLTWFDRAGKPTAVVGLPGVYHNVRLSPDGRRIVGEETDSSGLKTDIWTHGTAGDTATRLTFDPALHQTPIWSPDGKRILFGLGGKNSLYLKHSDGSGSQEFVADVGQDFIVNPWDWSRDGKYVLIRRMNELWYLVWPERTLKPLLQAKWTVRNAQFSPDGRWVAYASNETGNMEIYVSPFPGTNSKWQVSSSGGEEPRWRQDGKELFYVSAEGKMMSVEVKPGASFEAGSPVALFQTHRRRPISALDVFSYDVSADGQRFLIATKADEGTATPISIFLNWASNMEQ